ncbi:hypothetical protein TERTU_4099 [Teredinibacter turnerae T7901]|uniref:Uncharacterized protein n=1 Tax=Teredinibacter turnerae (strain ATCC 39867 / T7901) TaxID=377629 RepID=C5BUF4_TERTT|nr:hypothetical protein TERTU_4099 [Teredinibacter turnerae T7901]
MCVCTSVKLHVHGNSECGNQCVGASAERLMSRRNGQIPTLSERTH